MKYSALFFSTLLCLSACKSVDIQDGKVPSEYLAQMKKYEGIYHGSFESNASQIEIRFKNDIPEVIYTDEFGHEILDEKCHSHIGQLKKLTVYDEDNNTFNSQAVFAFDPGSCTDVKGRELTLELKDEKKFTVEILNEVHQSMSCHRGGCHPIGSNIYLEGSFSR